jgi:hypothetical protein
MKKGLYNNKLHKNSFAWVLFSKLNLKKPKNKTYVFYAVLIALVIILGTLIK